MNFVFVSLLKGNELYHEPTLVTKRGRGLYENFKAHHTNGSNYDIVIKSHCGDGIMEKEHRIKGDASFDSLIKTAIKFHELLEKDALKEFEIVYEDTK